MKIRAATWALAASAVVCVVGVHARSDKTSGGQPEFLSTRSAAVKVFAGLGDVPESDMTIELAPRGLDPIRIVPGDFAHEVWRGDERLGPADPDAVDGLVSSLRLSATLRAVQGVVATTGGAGTITVTAGGQVTAVRVGPATPEGSGRYADLGDRGGWVVEAELADLLSYEAEAWLAHRLLGVDPAQVERIVWAQGSEVRRGPDGLWRSRVGSGSALLSSSAVESGLQRLLGARLSPWVTREADLDATTAWLRIEIPQGAFELRRADTCPSSPGRVLVWRGSGWGGCIERASTEPWQSWGSPQAGPSAWVEPRLLPHPYGRVVRIDQTSPHLQTLRRAVSAWRLEGASTGDAVDVADTEVYRWYQRLHDVEVELDPSESPLDPSAAGVPSDPTIEFVVHTDTTAALRLRCYERGDDIWCRRDDGPLLHVRGGSGARPPIALHRDRFLSRELVELDPSEARAIEITDAGGGDVVRQSVHFDLGVWRLDAPVHPEGDGALDETALEDLLATLAGLEAERWIDDDDVPAGAFERTVRVERANPRGDGGAIEIVLGVDCLVQVGARHATIGSSACARLGRDLLHTDALAYWRRTARGLELRGEATGRWKRHGERLLAEEAVDPGADAVLERLTQTVFGRISAEPPPAEALGTLRVLPAAGPVFSLSYGPGWARIDDLPWVYRW